MVDQIGKCFNSTWSAFAMLVASKIESNVEVKLRKIISDIMNPFNERVDKI